MLTVSMFPLWIALHAAPQSVAAPAWKTVQVPEALAAFYADHLALALRQRGLKVVSASEIAAMLSQERQKQLLGCAEDSSSCLAELGAALGCDATLLVNLAKLEDTYQGTLKVVQSTDASVLAETSVQASGEKGLLSALDAAADRLVQALAPPGPPVTEVRSSSSGARRFWWIPATTAAIGATLAVVGFVNAGNAYATLEAELSGRVLDPHSADAEDMASFGMTMQTLGWIGAGVTAASLVALGAVLLFGDAPVQPAVSLAPGAATFGLTWCWP
ncbi:MAG: hypothetical protein AB1938_31575 [Myxococcota bacterium]